MVRLISPGKATTGIQSFRASQTLSEVAHFGVSRSPQSMRHGSGSIEHSRTGPARLSNPQNTAKPGTAVQVPDTFTNTSFTIVTNDKGRYGCSSCWSDL